MTDPVPTSPAPIVASLDTELPTLPTCPTRASCSARARAHGLGGLARRATVPETLRAADDVTVVATVLSGNPEAFAVLIERYADPCYRHALSVVAAPDVAEEVLQRAFIKAFRALGDVREHVDRWIFRIVANEAKDWLKDIRQRRHLPYDEAAAFTSHSLAGAQGGANDAGERSTPLAPVLPTPWPAPDVALERAEFMEALDRALAEIPPIYREAFLLRHVEGRAHTEIAALTGTSLGASKMRIHRACEQLALKLRAFGRVA